MKKGIGIPRKESHVVLSGRNPLRAGLSTEGFQEQLDPGAYVSLSAPGFFLPLSFFISQLCFSLYWLPFQADFSWKCHWLWKLQAFIFTVWNPMESRQTSLLVDLARFCDWLSFYLHSAILNQSQQPDHVHGSD